MQALLRIIERSFSGEEETVTLLKDQIEFTKARIRGLSD